MNITFTDKTLASIFGYTSDQLNLIDLNKNIFLQYRDKSKKSKEFEQYEIYCNSIINQFPNFPGTLSAKKFTLSEKLTKVNAIVIDATTKLLTIQRF